MLAAVIICLLPFAVVALLIAVDPLNVSMKHTPDPDPAELAEVDALLARFG